MSIFSVLHFTVDKKTFINYLKDFEGSQKLFFKFNAVDDENWCIQANGFPIINLFEQQIVHMSRDIDLLSSAAAISFPDYSDQIVCNSALRGWHG